MRCKYLIGAGFFIGILCGFAVPQMVMAGEPAVNDGILIHDKKLDADIYVVGAAFTDSGNLKAVKLAWIPESVKGDCLGKSFEECNNLWFLKASAYRESLRQKALRQNKIPVETGMKLSEDDCPDKPLTLWVSESDMDSANKEAFRHIMKMGILNDMARKSRGEIKISLSEDKKIHAAVRYFVFGNGESFQLNF